MQVFHGITLRSALLTALVWALWCLPGTAARAAWTIVAPSCSTDTESLSGPVFGFANNDYFLADTLLSGFGYWVQDPVDDEIAGLCTNHPTAPITVPLQAGFNLVGNPFADPLALSNLVDPAVEVVYAYRGNAYVKLDATSHIEPGEGVWWYTLSPAVKTFLALPDSGAGGVFTLVGACAPTPDTSPANRLVPGGGGCRLFPGTPSDQCPFTASFQLWEGGTLMVMGVTTEDPPAGGGCFTATPTAVERNDVALTPVPGGVVNTTAVTPPLGTFPWPTTNAVFSVAPESGAQGTVKLEAEHTPTATSSVTVVVREPITVTAAAPCPIPGETALTPGLREALSAACLNQGAAGTLSVEAVRDEEGLLSGQLGLAVRLSDGTTDLVPATQVSLANDFVPDADLELVPAGDTTFTYRAHIPLDVTLSLSGVTTYALSITEAGYSRIVVCPLTLLLQDPNVVNGPVGEGLPPLPPFQALQLGYVGGPLPSPVSAEDYALPQTSLDLCANQPSAITTQARLGQPVAWFTVGVPPGSTTGILLHLGTAAGWSTPERLAMADIPGSAGLVGMMPLQGGLILPAQVQSDEVFPLTLELDRASPASVALACSSAGQPAALCPEAAGAAQFTRAGSLTINATYDEPADNPWPDLPPFVGPLAVTPETEIDLNWGDPTGAHDEWPTATALALNIAAPTQDYSLSVWVGDVPVTRMVHIESGVGQGGGGGAEIRFCALAVDKNDSAAIAQAQADLDGHDCPVTTGITVAPGQFLMVSAMENTSGDYKMITMPNSGFVPAENMISGTGGGFVATYEISGPGTITMGIGPDNPFTLTVNF